MSNETNPPPVVPESPQTTPPKQPEAPTIKRPGFCCHDDWFMMHGRKWRPGLYWHGETTKGGDRKPVDEWICTPIHATAETADEQGSNCGLLLRYVDTRGRWKEWAAPMRLLQGLGNELIGELLAGGLRLQTSKRQRFFDWMMQQRPKRQIVAASVAGWALDGRAYVLPDRTIGAGDVRFQSESADAGQFSQRGSLAAWQKNIASKCQGNPLLILSASVAFAGPLLLRAKMQDQGGAGVHLVGDSSKGKTTALQVAGSVWGGPGFVRTWRATSNGQEAAASSLNDSLMVLDEISECDPREIGAVVYMLANGQGKQRATRSGTARHSYRWRLMVLSSGERTLAAHMAEARHQVKGGQAARLLDVPATNRQNGLFDDLHGCQDGRAFSDQLKQSIGKHYGTAGPAFVQSLLKDEQDLPKLYADARNLPRFRASDGISGRAAGWFALIGLAGELATEHGITGWQEGEAMSAAGFTFRSWRDFRETGEGTNETGQILANISDFLDTFGDSRFTDIDSKDPPRGMNRAGWFRDSFGGTEEREWLFTKPGLEEATRGYHRQRVIEALNDQGWIVESDKDRHTKKIRINGKGRNLYVIRPPGEK